MITKTLLEIVKKEEGARVSEEMIVINDMVGVTWVKTKVERLSARCLKIAGSGLA